VELALTELEVLANSTRDIRANCEEVTLEDGRKIYVLAKGRLVNLAAAEGHPSEVMDMSFANQVKAMILLAREGANMKNEVYVLPAEIDEEIAGIKLRSMGSELDVLTPEQIAYADAYSEGT
jgi:adenosylhomocysteinase